MPQNTILSINPATGEVLKSFQPLDAAQIEEKLAKADQTFCHYRHTPFADRAFRMNRIAEILEGEKDTLARLLTLEMGKPIKAAVSEVLKCAWVCRYYAENAEKFLSDQTIKTDAAQCFIRYQPLGAVLAIMPWNFPFWQVFRFVAPALMAGNVGLLKHASNVPQSALAIEEIVLRAGFPGGAFQTLLIRSDGIGQVIDDRRIKAVTLTGSTPAGSQVASRAGKLIKKTVLELGGSDPFIILPSGDLEEAASTAVKARMINNGESCIAAKRFIVAEKIYPEFRRLFIQGMAALKIGNPMDPAIDLGPLATREILDSVASQVQKSIQAGARLVMGGKGMDRPGNYYPPTILEDIPKDSPAYKEEVFGPVAMLFEVKNLDDAIRLANDTNFGLGASAWTNDPVEKERLIDELEAGMVFINGLVASDPRVPFGGVKESGYGRELSEIGIHEFVNIKTVSITH